MTCKDQRAPSPSLGTGLHPTKVEKQSWRPLQHHHDRDTKWKTSGAARELGTGQVGSRRDEDEGQPADREQREGKRGRARALASLRGAADLLRKELSP